jgi:YHS domain-containing protein
MSCNSQPVEKKPNELQAIDKKQNIKNTIKPEQLVMKKDPVCGMPVYKFLEDTTLYKGNIYGFCGKGCKDEFIINPEHYISTLNKKTTKP